MWTTEVKDVSDRTIYNGNWSQTGIQKHNPGLCALYFNNALPNSLGHVCGGCMLLGDIINHLVIVWTTVLGIGLIYKWPGNGELNG